MVDEWSGSAVHDGGWNGRDVSYTDPFTIDNWEYYKYPLLIWTGTSGGLNHPSLKSGSTAKEAAEAAMVKGEDAYYYDADTQTIYFSQPNITNTTTHFYVAYSTKIKCDVLDAQVGDSNYTFSNLVQKHEEKTITPNDEPPEKVDVTIKQPSDLVQKSYQETLLPGVLQFSLHINPEGKNLSNGSTIDIEDIFKATGYEDKCTVTSGTKNVTDPNGKLVDTLMSNIVLYEVDVNGNKTRLPSSEYSMQFENGDSVNGGSALLKLTIPDEKHIYIEYTYKMIANENTPSVINGCWASQLVNGMRVKMQPGMVPPAGDIITFSNEAKLEADSATGEDSTDDTKYEVSESSGTISTNRLPKIYKVNTGDYTINDLQATFYLAKYENGQWYYATQIDDKHRLTWGKTGFEGAKVDPDALEINVQEAYQVVLGQNTLYKLVEISVPNGYAGSNLLNGNAAAFREMLLRYMNEGTTEYNGVDYSNFLTKYRHTNYFSYNSTISSYPEGITANQVMQIKSGDNIEIPNNELIDLSVSKQWIGSATEAEQADSSITVELYWSDKKVTTGMPDNAKLVDPADLGIQIPEGETFSATKTIPMAMLDGKQNIWTDLPNGLDSGTGNKPIYYYIKETAYTIGGKTYTLQSDGTFKTEAVEGETSEVGSYLPIYVGNAANTDTSITVKNTQKLMLQKEWKDANNNPLSENKIPDKILVSIYGVDENGAQTPSPIFSNVELKKTENWTKDITALLGSKQLNYKSYIAKEEVPEGETAQLNHYVISCVFNLNENSGDITITNKSNVPSSTSLEVRKQWNDGTEIHAEDSIHVSVWRSTEKIPDAELANLTTAVLEKYHAEKMVSPTGPAEEGQTLPSYEVDLNAANSWKYIWTDLAIEDESTTPAQKYYYYVYEDLGQSTIQDASSVNPNGTSKYQPSYTLNAQTNGKTTYTISNSRNSIVAQKVWYDENGKQIVNVYDEDGNLVEDNMSNLPPITLDVYKKTEVPEMLKIQTFGDSISQGSGWNESNETYASDAYLGTLLKSSDYGSFKNVTINNTSQGGQEISYSNGKSISDGDNIICIMLGTNNVLHNVKYGSDGNDTNDLQKMIKQLYSNQEVLKSKPIFLASIPYLNYTGDFAYSNQCGNTSSGNTLRDWGEEKKYGITGTTKEIEEQMNALVDNYNSYVGSVVRDLNIDGYKVYFVDVNSKIDKDEDYYDGCHLSKKGITKMAQAFAIAINGYYKSEKLGTITLNKDNNWMASCDIVGGSASDEYYVVETNVPTGWTKEITDAAGNIIPNDGSSNAQKAGSGTPITVANKRSIPKTALSVEKTWVNDNAATDSTNREKISLILQQSTDGETWVDTAIAMPPIDPGLSSENTWIYKYTDLPTQDINGNQYYYRIREEVLDGYTTSYGEKDGLLAVEGTTGTLHVTNTRGISLTVNKVWMDENGEALTEGLPTAITVKIHRATSLNDVPDDVKDNLILQVPATASVGVGKDVTVTANKNVTEVTSSNPEIATVTCDGNQITIYGEAEGTATITVTDGKTTEEIAVTVSALEIYLDGVQNFTMVAGETGTLTAKKGNSEVSATFTIIEGANLVTLNGSQMTANAAGKVTVKATTADGLETTATISISLPETFEISGPSEVMAGGDPIKLEIDKPYGTFTWSASNGNATVDGNGNVTGVTKGEVVITATRNDGVKATYNVTIKGEPDLPNSTAVLSSNHSVSIPSGYSATKIVIEFERTSGSNNFYFQLNGSQGGGNVNTVNGEWKFVGGHPWGTGINEGYTFVSDGEKALGTLTFGDNISVLDLIPNGSSWNIRYVLTCKNASGEEKYVVYPSSVSRTAPQQVRAASVAAEEIMPMLGAANTPVDFIDDVATITLSPTSGPDGEGWIYIVPDLPVYSGNAPYYYWVEEVSAGEGELSNYEVSYLFDDANNDTTYVIDAANPGDATATIRNTKTQNESYELPSTGGIGTRWYTIAGLFMLGGGCGGLATTHLIRRFRRRKCTK
ncbi:MAG: Cna B-type domain-containing protein [Oscillospiraceae bacterium]|nr:Cna B-type domain-containing protein [Oscillospiraceae bacterium]